jgi:outer membrane biosynthesis protein TonB
MLKNQIQRSLLAIVAIVTLFSMPALLQAAELHRLVVVGIPADKIASAHPTPEYPQTGLNLRISGDVVVTVRVENGEVIETATASGPPLLAYSASRWVTYQWKFKPTVSGVFRIPISYKESA